MWLSVSRIRKLYIFSLRNLDCARSNQAACTAALILVYGIITHQDCTDGIIKREAGFCFDKCAPGQNCSLVFPCSKCLLSGDGRQGVPCFVMSCCKDIQILLCPQRSLQGEADRSSCRQPHDRRLLRCSAADMQNVDSWSGQRTAWAPVKQAGVSAAHAAVLLEWLNATRHRSVGKRGVSHRPATCSSTSGLVRSQFLLCHWLLLAGA